MGLDSSETILTIFPRNGESGSNHKKRSKKKGEVKATFRYRGKGAFNQGTHFLINQKGKEITISKEYYLRSQLYFSSKKKKYVFCSVLKFQTQRCRYAELSAFKDWAISTEPNMASTRQKCAIHSWWTDKLGAFLNTNWVTWFQDTIFYCIYEGIYSITLVVMGGGIVAAHSCIFFTWSALPWVVYWEMTTMRTNGTKSWDRTCKWRNFLD